MYFQSIYFCINCNLFYWSIKQKLRKKLPLEYLKIIYPISLNHLMISLNINNLFQNEYKYEPRRMENFDSKITQFNILFYI